jgi:hypothetical protein
MAAQQSPLCLPAFCPLLSLVIAALGLTAHAARPRPQPLRHSARAAARPTLEATLARLPLTFEANQGQTSPQVNFLARSPGYTLFLTAGEAVLSLPQRTHRAGNSGGVEEWKSGRTPDRLHSSTLPLLRSTAPSASSASSAVSASGPETLRLGLVGSNRQAKVSGVGELPGRSHYYVGRDPRAWRTNVAH